MTAIGITTAIVFAVTLACRKWAEGWLEPEDWWGSAGVAAIYAVYASLIYWCLLSIG